MKYLILLLMLSGCAHKHQVSIPPEFQPYVAQWHVDAVDTINYDIRIDDLIVEFDSINPVYTSICVTKTNTTPHIKVNYNDWVGFTELRRRLIIYHELGHCILGKGHNNSIVMMTSKKGWTYHGPLSIMYYAEDISEQYWANFQDVILREYFE